MNMKIERRNVNGSIRDSVYQTLRAHILNLSLEPGRSISESEISEMLEVSRTPVREAFLRLTQEELLEVYPQRGTFVSLIDLDLVEEGRFMREHMERAVIKQASKRFPMEALLKLESNLKMQELSMESKDYTRLFELDEEFHRTIFQGCNKSRIWNSIHLMNADFNRMRMLRILVNLDWDKILTHHTNIFKAIKEKDPMQAESVMKEHLRLVFVEGDELKEQYPRYFK